MRASEKAPLFPLIHDERSATTQRGGPVPYGNLCALKATLDKTEDGDTLTAAAALKIVATADVTEDDDTLTALGIYSNVASLDCTEEDDTLTATIRFDDVLVTVLRPRVSNITLSRSSPYQITAMLGSADNITVSRTSPAQITSARPNYSVITA